MKAPITSVKHIVQHTNTVTATANVASHIVVDTLAIGTARATTADVWEGCVIKAIYFEEWLNNQAADNDGQQIFIICKLPNGVAVPTGTNMLNLSAWENKGNILFTSQGNISNTDAPSQNIIRNWVKIPKGKQRMKLGDRIGAFMAPVGESIADCGLAIYKEYS